MRHIKEYESKYKKGDYILVKFIFDKPLSEHDRIRTFIDDENKTFAKIINDDYSGLGISFRVIIYGGYDIVVEENEIVRKLTSDEIRDYKVKEDMTKYNL